MMKLVAIFIYIAKISLIEVCFMGEKLDSVELIDTFETFFKDYRDSKGQKYKNMINNMIIENKTSLEVSFNDLLNYDYKVAQQLLTFPQEVIGAANKGLSNYIKKIDTDFWSLAKPFFVRFVDLMRVENIDTLSSKSLGKLIQVRATVTKVKQVTPVLYEGRFKCMKCGTILSELASDYKLTWPAMCKTPECQSKGPFHFLENDSIYLDSQIIQLGESSINGKRQLEGRLIGDIVNSISKGDLVMAVGILKVRVFYKQEDYHKEGERSEFRFWIDINSIRRIKTAADKKIHLQKLILKLLERYPQGFPLDFLYYIGRSESILNKEIYQFVNELKFEGKLKIKKGYIVELSV